MTENKEAQTGGGKSVALEAGRAGIIGVKAGMTQVYNEKGESFAVTVIDLQQNVISQIKSKDTDGYKAIQVGVVEKKASKVNKSEAGRAKKTGKTGFYHYKEFRLPDSADVSNLAIGDVLNAGFIKVGDLVDLQAISKGKGFQGVMKKYNYRGGNATHGASLNHRSVGSIGNRADPGKVFKGKKMAGQMGNAKVSIQNVKVIKVDLENGILLVNGSVPGPRSGLVTIRKAIKYLELG